MTLSPGSVLGERYRLVEPLGAGGMGVVWAAERLDGNVPVAIKLIKTAPDSSVLRRRFLREARAVAAIEHPNVVRMFEVLELEDGAPAIVMERLTGETLAERVNREGALPLSEVAHMMILVVSAVGAAHALGIVHRDLKPDNIFLIRQQDGTTDVKVLDFGIAKLTLTEGQPGPSAGGTTTGDFLGTPSYMSPEQVFGEKDIDHRTDLWSIGMILYESLSGILPTREDNLGQIIKIILTRSNWRFGEVAPDLPDSVKDLVRRLLQRARTRRPSLHAVAAVLREFSTTAAPSFGEPASHQARLDRISENRPSRAFALASTIAVSGAPRPLSTKLLVGAAVAAGVAVIGSTFAWLENRDTTLSSSAEPAAEQPPRIAPSVPPRVTGVDPPASPAAAPPSVPPPQSASASLRAPRPKSKRSPPTPKKSESVDRVWGER